MDGYSGSVRPLNGSTQADRVLGAKAKGEAHQRKRGRDQKKLREQAKAKEDKVKRSRVSPEAEEVFTEEDLQLNETDEEMGYGKSRQRRLINKYIDVII